MKFDKSNTLRKSTRCSDCNDLVYRVDIAGAGTHHESYHCPACGGEVTGVELA